MTPGLASASHTSRRGFHRKHAIILLRVLDDPWVSFGISYLATRVQIPFGLKIRSRDKQLSNYSLIFIVVAFVIFSLSLEISLWMTSPLGALPLSIR